jgi:asparagine synthase (glutamine-hydrolysing)
MCGISGLIGTSVTGMNELINVMNNALSHRGPDDEGYYVSNEGDPVVLGHRRLSIIDPEGGKQPLCNEDGSVWITFNGCIYNYMELAQVLRQKGHRFTTHTDTEVIVHAYEEYGPDCVEKFIGMFAFAIWDTRRKELFCARDRIGVKPFYYWQHDNTFLFASEIKALLATSMFPPKVNACGLQEYLIFQASISDQTMFKDVYQLMPGHCMVIDATGNIRKLWQYWDLKFEPQIEQDEAYLVDHLRLLLEDAVKIRMRSDVPLGCHLSGGLDSSTVACLASKFNFSGEPIKTFNGTFSEGRILLCSACGRPNFL